MTTKEHNQRLSETCDAMNARKATIKVAVRGRPLRFSPPNRTCDFHRTRTCPLSVAINALGQHDHFYLISYP